IKKLYKDTTVIICTADCQSKMRHVSENAKVTLVAPSVKFQFENGKILVWTVPAYNTDKPVHSREEDWVGYILNFDGTQVYHAGDTDFIPEMKRMAGLDIALLPIGGTYTMNGGEAATAAKFINPQIAIPMHYGSISGEGEDVKAFMKFCSGEGVETKVLEKEDVMGSIE
ncbi:MBL fold metallo-hydrolase, partial [Dolichospermum sp. ST_sed4]|nr:MBL fold metallo-hydrolase [Dolichospermum sp. ST_sed4]